MNKKEFKRKSSNGQGIKPEAQFPDELASKLEVLLNKSESYDQRIEQFKELVTEFHRWNPMSGSIPNTRIIKKWREVMTVFLTESQDLNTSVKEVFHD